MIQANELRIGNWVMYNGMVTSVSGIESPKPRKDKKFDEKYLIEIFDGTGFITATQDQILVIPLTEEILLNCGFKLDKHNTYTNPLYDLSILMPNSCQVHKNGRVYYNNWKIMDKSIEHVHQLQNIIHAITNTELKINLHSK